MMIESFYIGAYWYNRAQTADECVTELLSLASQLRSRDPVFAQWYLTDKSRASALKNQISFGSQSQLKIVIDRMLGATKKPIGGYRFSLWNGLDDDNTSGLSCSCGDDAGRIPNNCILTLPYAEDVSQRLLSVENICQLVRLISNTWRPQWIKVSSQVIDDFIDNSGLSRQLGWATFIKSATSSLSRLPSSFHAEECGGSGHLIFASSNAHTFSSSPELEHLRILDAIYN